MEQGKVTGTYSTFKPCPNCGHTTDIFITDYPNRIVDNCARCNFIYKIKYKEESYMYCDNITHTKVELIEVQEKHIGGRHYYKCPLCGKEVSITEYRLKEGRREYYETRR